jgi:hypothetical protein
MKKIDESAINSQTGMLSPSGVLQFLQDMTKDSILNSLIGNWKNISTSSGGVIVFNGAANINFSSPTTTWRSFEGVALYNGELFYVPAANLGTFVNTPVVVLVTSFNNIAANADPVLFTDGTSRNVLQTRTMQIVDGTSATSGYICDASALSYSTNIDPTTASFIQNGSGATITTTSSIIGGGGFELSRKGNAKITATMQLHVASGITENAQIKITKNGTAVYTAIETLVASSGTFYNTITIFSYLGQVNSTDLIDITLTSISGNAITVSAVNALLETI